MDPTPTIAPVIVWVVLQGKPSDGDLVKLSVGSVPEEATGQRREWGAKASGRIPPRLESAVEPYTPWSGRNAEALRPLANSAVHSVVRLFGRVTAQGRIGFARHQPVPQHSIELCRRHAVGV